MTIRLLLLVLTFATATLPGCATDADTITVYSGRTENLIQPLIDRFVDETGIEVEVRYGDSADLALLIDQEGDRSPADVVISQSPGAVGFLAGNGRLARLSDDVLDQVAPEFRNTDGLWVGMSGRIRVLVYNTEMVTAAELPDSVFDLTDPAYRGEVAVAPTNGSFQDFVTAMRQIHGDDVAAEWLASMADNDAQPYANNSAIVQAVGRGEVPMGLVNHYYNLRALAEDPSLSSANHFFADGDVGSLLIATAIGVLATSDDPEAANRFAEYMLGETAQTFFTNETFEYPLAADVTPAPSVPDLADVSLTTYDFDDLGGGLERTKQLIDDSGLESP